MDLSPRTPDSPLSPRQEAEPARAAAPATDEWVQARASARDAVSSGFAVVYGADGHSAERAFTEMAAREGLRGTLPVLSERPETFGALAARGETVAPRLAGAVGVAAQIGSYGERAQQAARALADERADETRAARTGAVAGREPNALAAAPAGVTLASATPASRGLTQNPPDALGRTLTWLYEVNESPEGSAVVMALSAVPGMDTALDVADVALNVWRVSQPEYRRDPEAWTNLALTAAGAAITVPFVGDAVELALKRVIQGGPRAAAQIVETVGPILRRAGIDPADFFERQARAAPGLIDRGVVRVTNAVARGLEAIGGQDRWYVPNGVERAAIANAVEMRALGEAARRGLAAAAETVAQAFDRLAVAAGGSARRADPGDARRAPDEPDAPEPRRAPDGPSRTQPTGEIGGRPTGDRTRVKPQDDAATRGGITGENAAAETLADRGYRVQQNPPPKPNGKEPDYLLEGRYADAYTPQPNTSPRNIASTIGGKVDDGQADRIVLNLNSWRGDMDALRAQFERWPVAGLREVLVTRGGRVANLTLPR